VTKTFQMVQFFGVIDNVIKILEVAYSMMRPYHHGMVRPQVADGGTASNMEGSCEYIQ